MIVIGHWYYSYYNSFSDMLQVVALDVGQGSGIYIKTPGGKEMIIDTGPTTRTFRSLNSYRWFFDYTIDYLFVTHVDYDHMAMVPDMLHRYRIDNFVISAGTSDSNLYQTTVQSVQHEGSAVFVPQPGDTWVVDTDCYIEFLWPPIDMVDSLERNDTSLVFRIVYGDTSILITGDMSMRVERALLTQYDGDDVQADLLVVAHHGSKTSSGIDFVRAVDPQYAVIQSGIDNQYGHPHSATLATLGALHIPTARTDQQGSIRYISDGRHFLVQ